MLSFTACNIVSVQGIFLDPSKSLDDRAKDLIWKLTLNEKVRQMMNSARVRQNQSLGMNKYAEVVLTEKK